MDTAAIVASIKHLIRTVTHYDVVRFDPSFHAGARHCKLLGVHGVDLVIDVGANAGQYAQGLRREGYHGEIVSFEPLSEAYAKLEKAAAADTKWKCMNVALGREVTQTDINVSGRSTSSSLLRMHERHVTSSPDSAYERTERVRVETLDAVAPTYLSLGSRRLLKVDTQGYEMHVLEGAKECLDKFVGLELELSLQPLYEGAPQYLDLLHYVHSRGFTLMSFEPVFCDRTTGQVLQFDGLFFRTELSC